MIKTDISVTLGGSLTRNPASIPSIEVNLVGVNETELPQWQGYSVTKYWSPGDKLRAGADKYEMRFGQTKPSVQTLKKDNPIFQKWQEKTATQLFVLADLPGMGEPEGDEADPRRVILPLSPKAWKLKEGITITIRAGQMVCSPAPIEEK